MSNIKSVLIRGEAPFNLYEDESLARQLAFLAGPTSGISITWEDIARRPVPNESGGLTTMYRFNLQGQEAVRAEWLRAFTTSIVRLGGRIDSWEVFDIEANGIGHPEAIAQFA